MGCSSAGHSREKVVLAGTARRRAGVGTLSVCAVGPRKVAEEGGREVVRSRRAEAVVLRNPTAEVRAGSTMHSEEEHHRAVGRVHHTVPTAARAVVVRIPVAVAGRRCIDHEAEVHHMVVADDAAEEEAVGNIRLHVVEVVLRGLRLALKTSICNYNILSTYGHKATPEDSLDKTL